MSPAFAEVVFWVAAASCAIAQIALLLSAIRSPMAGSPDNPVLMPRRSKEIAWTVVPAIALALLFASTWRAMHPPTMMNEMPNMPAGHRMIEE